MATPVLNATISSASRAISAHSRPPMTAHGPNRNGWAAMLAAAGWTSDRPRGGQQPDGQQAEIEPQRQDQRAFVGASGAGDDGGQGVEDGRQHRQQGCEGERVAAWAQHDQHAHEPQRDTEPADGPTGSPVNGRESSAMNKGAVYKATAAADRLISGSAL